MGSGKGQAKRVNAVSNSVGQEPTPGFGFKDYFNKKSLRRRQNKLIDKALKADGFPNVSKEANLSVWRMIMEGKNDDVDDRTRVKIISDMHIDSYYVMLGYGSGRQGDVMRKGREKEFWKYLKINCEVNKLSDFLEKGEVSEADKTKFAKQVNTAEIMSLLTYTVLYGGDTFIERNQTEIIGRLNGKPTIREQMYERGYYR